MNLRSVLFWNWFPPRVGGAQHTNYELVTSVASNGLEAEVITEPLEGDAEFDRMYYRDHGVRVHRMPLTTSSTTSPPPDDEVKKLTRFMCDFLRAKQESGKMPDIIVVGADKYAWYNRILKGFGVPVVQHLMGTPTNTIKRGIYSPEKTKEYLEAVAEADHIVCIAHHFKKLVLEVVPNSCERWVSVIHNDLDTSMFSPGPPDPALRKKLSLPEEAQVIVHVSDFRPNKRVEDIIASAEMILDDHPGVFYLLVGGKKYYEGIASLVEASDHVSHFRLTRGKVSQDVVAAHLKQATIFILSSRAEGLPRAAMEAQASGLYLIASDCEAGRELTANGTVGSIYPAGDAKALAETTLQVLEMDAERFDEVRRAGRDMILKSCSKGVQMRKYVALLNQVYESARKR